MFDQLVLGGWRSTDAVVKGLVHVDVIFPLASTSVDHTIWHGDWYGLINYVPIKDRGILPPRVLEKKVDEVLRCLNAGLKVMICCMGGHGRTGYFASCVLGKWKPELGDPVKYLRKHYCEEVVESEEQLDAIAEFLNNPKIAEENEPADKVTVASTGYYEYYWDWDNHYDYTCSRGSYSKKCPICGVYIQDKENYCKECERYVMKGLVDKCKYCGNYTFITDKVCYKCKWIEERTLNLNKKEGD